MTLPKDVPPDKADKLRAEIQDALQKIAALPTLPKIEPDSETQARTLKSLLRIAKVVVKSDDPDVDKERLAALISFLEEETRKENPSQVTLQNYLRKSRFALK